MGRGHCGVLEVLGGPRVFRGRGGSRGARGPQGSRPGPPGLPETPAHLRRRRDAVRARAPAAASRSAVHPVSRVSQRPRPLALGGAGQTAAAGRGLRAHRGGSRSQDRAHAPPRSAATPTVADRGAPQNCPPHTGAGRARVPPRNQRSCGGLRPRPPWEPRPAPWKSPAQARSRTRKDPSSDQAQCARSVLICKMGASALCRGVASTSTIGSAPRLCTRSILGPRWAQIRAGLASPVTLCLLKTPAI